MLLSLVKKRRDAILTREITKLVSRNQEQAHLPHVYYEAAKSFAKDNGASMSRYKNDPEDDTLIFYLKIAGNSYYVCVQKFFDGGTMLTVKDEEQSREETRKLMGML